MPLANKIIYIHRTLYLHHFFLKPVFAEYYQLLILLLFFNQRFEMYSFQNKFFFSLSLRNIFFQKCYPKLGFVGMSSLVLVILTYQTFAKLKNMKTFSTGFRQLHPILPLCLLPSITIYLWTYLIQDFHVFLYTPSFLLH